MTRQEFAACMGVLEAAYPRTGKLSPQQLVVWFDNLSDLTVDQLRRAVTVAVREGDDWPTISKLRRYSGADGIPSKDRPLLAWNAVREAISKLNRCNSVNFDDPVVNAVIRQLGGWPELTYTPSKEMQWLERRFCETYSALSSVALSDEQTSRLPGMSRSAEDRHGKTITWQEVVDVHCLTGPCTASKSIAKRFELLEPPKTETTRQSPELEREDLARQQARFVRLRDSDAAEWLPDGQYRKPYRRS